MKATITLLLLLTLFSLNTFAQDYTQWSLPEGAIARLGKGRISGNLAYSPDGTRLAVRCGIGVWLYDTSTGQEIALLTASWGVGVAFSPDGLTIASGSDDDTIRLWDARSGVHKHILTGHTDSVNSVVFSPDGRTLASGSRDKTIRLWDVVSGAHTRTITGHTGSVRSVAFSPDGYTLASGSGDETIQLWDAGTGAHIDTLLKHIKGVSSVAFSPDGYTLASGSWDETIRLWDVASGELKHTLPDHTRWVSSVAFSPDSRTIVSGSWDETIRLWDTTPGSPKRTLTGHTDEINSVAFSPDSRTIASGSDDNTIRLWDAETGTEKRRLTGHTAGVLSVAFSTDGRILASGSRDETIRLWDVESGAHTHTITGHTGSVTSVAFSPDGLTLASGSRDGTVLLWELISFATITSTVSISPSLVPSPAIGAQLTLSLKIADGENVAGYQATVQFDTTALRYVESANGDFLPAGAFFVSPVVDGNRVRLASTAIAAISNGAGTLATLTFEVVAVKASALTLIQVALVDSDRKRWLPHIENGAVTRPPQLVGDVNTDGVVNIQDLVLVGANFGKIGANTEDVNGDGVVDIVDLVKVAGALGNTATAPTLHAQALTTLTAAEIQEWLIQARWLDLTDAALQRGVVVLEYLLATLTPKETILLPNYPNPFNPETWIPYHLAHPADVTLTIYDTKGAVVRRFELGHQPAGFYTARSKALYWNGRNASGEWVASGVYFYQLRAGNYSALRRMVIVK